MLKHNELLFLIKHVINEIFSNFFFFFLLNVFDGTFHYRLGNNLNCGEICRCQRVWGLIMLTLVIGLKQNKVVKTKVSEYSLLKLETGFFFNIFFPIFRLLFKNPHLSNIYFIGKKYHSFLKRKKQKT